MKKALLLTASFGSGHNQAAYAVKDALDHQGITTRIEDYVDWLPKPLQRFTQFALKQGVKNIPRVYGAFYEATSRIKPTSSIQRRLNRLGMSGLLKALCEFNPDAIVSTFPMPDGMVSELRSAGMTTASTHCIITDYTLHRQWVHAHTDRYFVGSDDVKQELLSCGVPTHRIEVSGIPIRASFDGATVGKLLRDRQTLREKNGFSLTEPVVLVMGGGYGLIDEGDVWTSLVQRSSAQFVFICGRNQHLYEMLKPLESNKVRVLGFIDDVNRWMAMSDLLLTKAGGLTLTEAFAMELPMVLLPAIPGQEMMNAEFAVRRGAAVQLDEMDVLEPLLAHLVANPEALQKMRQAAAQLARPDAAARIASVITRSTRRFQGKINPVVAYQE